MVESSGCVLCVGFSDALDLFPFYKNVNSCIRVHADISLYWISLYALILFKFWRETGKFMEHVSYFTEFDRVCSSVSTAEARILVKRKENMF